MIEFNVSLSWQQALILVLLYTLLHPVMSGLGQRAYHSLKEMFKK